MKKIIISFNYGISNNAGSKAKNDIESFLCSDGFLKFEVNINRLARNSFKRLKTINPDLIVLQYGGISMISFFKVMKLLKNDSAGKIVIVVHDIESLRTFNKKRAISLNYVKSKFEIKMLNMADSLIVHNDFMKKKMMLMGFKPEMISIKIFDYLNSHELCKTFYYNHDICFAGELSKSVFLRNLNLKNHSLSVFGPNPLSKYPENVNYRGEYKPEELPLHLNQSFGVVWDGISTKTCEGIVGNYLKYNNPHKTSLYLSCGVPVIVWSKAAIASFVVNNNLGFSIDSLDNLDDLLDSISYDEYVVVRKNCLNISNKIRNGFFIKKAIKEISNKIN
ncbi:MAG: galactofuranosyltransferase [Liquorilactobacillus nagelii]|jgi:hypothetical protein|uniref:galactofuranosyltransferase n=1 Tax=Liquorilactobacillus nagelii TaxID=82688 RepID=UPI00242F57ED|nr:galactofuranosyltransferase [Liquorilactobacillus nagelii]MCI1922067.1 galactofuranosyltransferase [Liquorilactobacillus nagelii]MCI1977454.1 galactofuranosyltransferase [Liquorilactobacillus nagelii]